MSKVSEHRQLLRRARREALRRTRRQAAFAPQTYKGLYIGNGLLGGYHQDLNFRYIADRLQAIAGGEDEVAWDDFAVPQEPSLRGSRAKPDYDETEMGLLWPQNDSSEFVNFVQQMKHAKKLNTGLRLHVHFIQSAEALPTFVAEYRWYNNGAAVPAGFTTISTADGNKGIFEYPGSGSILQIASFQEIDPIANENVSSNIDVKFYRDDDDVPGDVLGKYIDFHYQIDGLGSDQEYVK